MFTQEREEPANLRQTYDSHEESLLPAQSFFHTYKYGETVLKSTAVLFQKRKSSRDMENERMRILLQRQKG